MKKCLIALVFLLLFVPISRCLAQDPVTLIVKEAIVRVIRAADLQIQRMQNETIWLQNEQKTVENAMAKLKLEEIRDWVERQRTLYDDYFEELSKVKTVITYYHKVKTILDLEKAILRDYKRGLVAAQNDANLTADEVAYIAQVINGVLEQSEKDVESLSLIVQSFATQMSDAARMNIINDIAERLEEKYSNLRRFSSQNLQLSASRAKNLSELRLVQALYGIQ